MTEGQPLNRRENVTSFHASSRESPEGSGRPQNAS